MLPLSTDSGIQYLPPLRVGRRFRAAVKVTTARADGRYDRRVTSQPPEPAGSAPTTWQSAPPQSPRRLRWPILKSLAIVLVVVGVAIGAAVRPLFTGKHAAPAAPAYTAQQVADAKAAMCTAYWKVGRAMEIADARSGDDDPTATLAVATNIRQVLDFGSRYLLIKLALAPATPPDLAEALRTLADSYQEVTMGFLDGLNNSSPEQQPALRAGGAAALTIQRLCK
jgi:hypothetical protein